MKERLLIVTIFIVFIQTLTFAQGKNDFTSVGDNLNWTTTKFLLPPEDQAKFIFGSFESFIKLIDPKHDKIIVIAKEIEAKKVELKGKGINIDNFSVKVDELITFCLSKLKGSSKDGQEAVLKVELLKLKTTTLEKFKKLKENSDKPANDITSQIQGLNDSISSLELKNKKLQTLINEHEHKGFVTIDEFTWYFKWSGIIALAIVLIFITLILIFIKSNFKKGTIEAHDTYKNEKVDHNQALLSRIKIIEDNQNNGVKLSSKDFNTLADKLKTELKNEFKTINNRVETLEKGNKPQNNVRNESTTYSNYPQKNDYNKNNFTNQVQEESFYLKMPDASGFFWSDQKTNIIDSDTFFIVTAEKNNPTRGKFKPISDETLQKRAIMDIDITLKPVCVVEGNYNQQGTKIQLVSEGYLKLIGDKWELDDNRKCKIRIV